MSISMDAKLMDLCYVKGKGNGQKPAAIAKGG